MLSPEKAVNIFTGVNPFGEFRYTNSFQVCLSSRCVGGVGKSVNGLSLVG